MSNLRRPFSLSGVCIVMLFASVAALADQASTVAPATSKKNDVTQVVIVDGKPAKHVTVTLFNCLTDALVAGPVETDDGGSVKWAQVEDGKDCVRVERLAGSGSTADIIDHNSQGTHVDLTLSPLHPTWSERNLPYALCVGCFLLVCVPILQFLFGPWKARRDKLMGTLSGAPMKLYYQRFRANVIIVKANKGKGFLYRVTHGGGAQASVEGNHVPIDQTPVEDKYPSDKTLTYDDFDKAFKNNFGKWYGRQYYIVPVIVLAALTGCCAWWGALEAQGWIDGTRSIDSTPVTLRIR